MIAEDICVIVPSRGRPQNIVDLIEAWNGVAHLVVVVDKDDSEVDVYRNNQIRRWRSTPGALPDYTLIIDQRRRLGGSLNEVAPRMAHLYDVVGFMGDDHRPRTDDWDEQIAAAMPDLGVVYGNDLVQGAELPTAVFMDARIVRTLGHFVLPGQIHLWMDNYWKTLGEQLGTLRYLPDVIIEHVHPITGKVPWDEHYTANNASDVWENDERIYKEWVAHQMPADIAKVKAALL